MLFHRKEDGPDALLDPSSNVEELRAERVWQLITVGWCTWLFFVAFCWVRGYGLAAAICLVEVVGIWLLRYLHQSNQNYRRAMNLCLGACGAGILLLSVSEPALQRTMLYFPVSILIASQLLGIQAAFQWLVVNIAANLIFILTRSGATAGTHWDELTLLCGVGACVFFCCHQGEDFFRERTKGLLDLSHALNRKANKLHALATTDSLTGLVNRFQFQKELHARVKYAVKENESVALVMIDMDGFKEINDTLGHPIGDQALVEIANRLSEEFHNDAVIARLGGDEFCLIFPGVGSVGQVTEIATRTCQVLTRRYVLDDCDFPLGASVGVAVAPDHTQCDTELLAYADTAMYFAKEHRTGFAPYEPKMTNRLVEYRRMQEQLSMALERNEFFLLYQPQVDLRTGKVCSVEALLRWRHHGEIVSPVRFIPLLEKSREIVPVGRWIIEESCRQLRQWTDAGLDIGVSINLSSIQFSDEGLHRHVTESVRSHGVDPEKLDFEITESLLVDDVTEAVERLTQLKQCGASISVDDFGTGYSSLAYLRQLPIDRLKIDRAFVKDIPNADDGVIASCIVALAKSLCLKVLAEGVETKAQLDFLKAIDCDEYQGYFFSKPVLPDEITQVVRRAPSSAPSGSPL